MRAVAVMLAALGCSPTIAESSNDRDDGASSSSDASKDSTSGVDATMGESSSDAHDPGGYEVDGGGEGCAFACPDPSGGSAGGSSGSGPCDVWMQDCPEGEKCMPWDAAGGSSWNATRCSPLDPDPRDVGDDCEVEGSGVSGIDDCDVGAMCWNVDPDTNHGTCVAFCRGWPGAPVCEDPSTSCAISNEGVLILCLPDCDPLTQDCADSEGCYPIAGRFLCMPDAGGDTGAYAEPCEYINVCDPGLYCAEHDAVPECRSGTGCCSAFCDLDAEDPDASCPDVAAGQVCLPFFPLGASPPGSTRMGACAMPTPDGAQAQPRAGSAR
jgi:hypothetical protein